MADKDEMVKPSVSKLNYKVEVPVFLKSIIFSPTFKILM